MITQEKKKKKKPKITYPIVISITGTERATTKLNSHCVAAAYETLMDRKRAEGISDARIQQAGPQPNWKNLSRKNKGVSVAGSTKVGTKINRKQS